MQNMQLVNEIGFRGKDFLLELCFLASFLNKQTTNLPNNASLCHLQQYSFIISAIVSPC